MSLWHGRNTCKLEWAAVTVEIPVSLNGNVCAFLPSLFHPRGACRQSPRDAPWLTLMVYVYPYNMQTCGSGDASRQLVSITKMFIIVVVHQFDWIYVINFCDWNFYYETQCQVKDRFTHARTRTHTATFLFWYIHTSERYISYPGRICESDELEGADVTLKHARTTTFPLLVMQALCNLSNVLQMRVLFMWSVDRSRNESWNAYKFKNSFKFWHY